MQTAAGLARSDLRRERHVHAVLAGQRADDPFGHHELIGGGLEVRGKEFDLVLLVHAVALREVPHLGVTVLDLAARLGDVFHGLRTERGALVEGRRFVVAPLVGGQKKILFRRDDVELQLAHHVKVQPGRAPQLLVRTAEGLLGSHVERFAVLRVVAAQDVHGGNPAEGIAERRAVARYDVQVARPGLDVGKEARPVHAFAAREDALQVILVVDDEVERLQAAVGPRITQVDHFDSVLPDIPDDVRTGESCPGLSEKAHQRVGIERRVHNISKV